MENVPHEVSVSLEALMALLTSSDANMDSQSIAARTVSSSSLSSTTPGGGSSAFEIRRAARRLDRALQTLEASLEQACEETQEEVTLGPLLQSDLVVVLTSLAQALDAQPSVDWRSQDVVQLYQDLAVTACRILIRNNGFLLYENEQLDALVDRIALLLLQQGSARVLSALISCVNAHLIHVEQHAMSGASQNDSSLFPLLRGLETIHLLKICIRKCSQDMVRRWNPNQEDGRFDLWSFISFLLKHLAECRGDQEMLEWLQNCFLQDQETREGYDANPQVLSQDVNGFLDKCRSFGVDLIEIALEVLDQASIETTLSEYAHVAIQHASLVFTTVQVLDKGLQVALPYSMLRSFFTAYASFVAILTHKYVEQEETEAKVIACELLVDLANFVLQNPQSRCANDVADSAMETAVSITLFCVLDTCGIKEEMNPILEYMRDQGRSTTLEKRPAAKRPRRDEQDGDPSSSESHQDKVLYTDILQTSVMASLMLPNSSSSSLDATQTKDSVARLVQSFPFESSEDPWHSLVARKVKESFGIDPTRNGDASDSLWNHRVLQKYVADQQASNKLQQQAVTAERNDASSS